MQRLRKFAHLSAADRMLLLKTAIWTIGVRIALSLFSFQTVRIFLTRRGEPIPGTLLNTDTPDIQRILWAVELISHYLLRERPCLTKALVAQMFLSREGYRTTLRIGVARSAANSLQAHAWLERDEEIVIGRLKNMGQFVPLPPLEMKKRRVG